MENGPFEDVLVSTKNGDIPSSHVSLPESNSEIQIHWKICHKKVRPGYQFDIGSPKITSRQARIVLVISISLISLHRSDTFFQGSGLIFSVFCELSTV